MRWTDKSSDNKPESKPETVLKTVEVEQTVDKYALSFGSFGNISKQSIEPSKIQAVISQHDTTCTTDTNNQSCDLGGRTPSQGSFHSTNTSEPMTLMRAAAKAHTFSSAIMIMIRHCTVLLLYLVVHLFRGLLPSIIPNTPEFGNISDIISNTLIYMMYPCGNNFYEKLCLCTTYNNQFESTNTQITQNNKSEIPQQDNIRHQIPSKRVPRISSFHVSS